MAGAQVMLSLRLEEGQQNERFYFKRQFFATKQF
jgi:hypothetical protein